MCRLHCVVYLYILCNSKTKLFLGFELINFTSRVKELKNFISEYHFFSEDLPWVLLWSLTTAIPVTFQFQGLVRSWPPYKFLTLALRDRWILRRRKFLAAPQHSLYLRMKFLIMVLLLTLTTSIAVGPQLNNGPFTLRAYLHVSAPLLPHSVRTALNPVYTIQPVIQPVGQPAGQTVGQLVALCKQTFNRLSNRLLNLFGHRLYRVNVVLRGHSE